jgi:fatty-acyl-CoA synthase
VHVPGREGAAGMAAIVPDGRLDVAGLRAHLARRLPSYARPKFLRVARRLAVTTTFKHTKNELQRDGFDPASTSDAIYFDDPASDRFVPLDQRLYERIKSGAVRF